MILQPTDDVYKYIQAAKLPYMPLTESAKEKMPVDRRNKSHKNHLRVDPKRWRNLDLVNTLVLELIDNVDMYEKLLDWWKKLAKQGYDGPPDDPFGEEFTMPAPPLFEQKRYKEFRVDDLQGVANWVDNYPMMTAQRFLHVTCEDLAAFGFKRVYTEKRGEEDLWRSFVWTVHRNAPELPCGPDGVMVFVQPPWILTIADMKELIRKGPLNVSTTAALTGTGKDGSDWTARDRVWAKMWDCCIQQKCYSFVLTTYENWIFGRFSNGRRLAFTSGVVPFDSEAPNPLEWFVWWLKTASSVTQWSQIDRLGESTEESIPEGGEGDEEEYLRTYLPPAASESDWSAKWSDAPTSARVRGTIADISENGVEKDDDEISERDSEFDDGPPQLPYALFTAEGLDVDLPYGVDSDVSDLGLTASERTRRRDGRMSFRHGKRRRTRSSSWSQESSDKENENEESEHDEDDDGDDDDDTRTVRNIPLMGGERPPAVGGSWIA